MIVIMYVGFIWSLLIIQTFVTMRWDNVLKVCQLFLVHYIIYDIYYHLLFGIMRHNNCLFYIFCFIPTKVELVVWTL